MGLTVRIPVVTGLANSISAWSVNDADESLEYEVHNQVTGEVLMKGTARKDSYRWIDLTEDYNDCKCPNCSPPSYDDDW